MPMVTSASQVSGSMSLRRLRSQRVMLSCRGLRWGDEIVLKAPPLVTMTLGRICLPRPHGLSMEVRWPKR